MNKSNPLLAIALKLQQESAINLRSLAAAVAMLTLQAPIQHQKKICASLHLGRGRILMTSEKKNKSNNIKFPSRSLWSGKDLPSSLCQGADGLRMMRLIWRISGLLPAVMIMHRSTGATLWSEPSWSIRTERGRGLIMEGQGFAGLHPLNSLYGRTCVFHKLSAEGRAVDDGVVW